jgi:opacity protein-like surface antigen
MRLLRLSAAAALSAAAVLPGALRAQLPSQDPAAASTSARPIRLGFGGGMVVPREGANARTVKSGMHGQGFVLVQLPAGLPALRFNVDASRMRLVPSGAQAPTVPLPGATPPTPDETVRSMLAGVASLKVDLLRGPVRPYVMAGLGAFRLSDEKQTGLGDDVRSQVDFGVEGGAGLSIRLGPIDAFAETRLQNVYTKQQGLIDQKSIRAFPITFGLIF